MISKSRSLLLFLFVSIVGSTLFGAESGFVKSLGEASFVKHFKYQWGLTFGYRQAYVLREINWYDQIELPRGKYPNARLFLGALPLRYKDIDHAEELQKIGVSSIFSMVEPFEISMPKTIFLFSMFSFEPIFPDEWVDKGVEQRVLATPDFEPVSVSDIEVAADHIHARLKAGHVLYAHCKSGKGRSASGVIGFFMKYYGMSFWDANSFVKAQRSVVKLNGGQRQSLIEFEEVLKQRRVFSLGDLTNEDL